MSKTQIVFNCKAVVDVREKMDFSQAELAKRMGKTTMTVYNWENGRTLPSITTLIALCRRFDVPISNFFKEERV